MGCSVDPLTITLEKCLEEDRVLCSYSGAFFLVLIGDGMEMVFQGQWMENGARGALAPAVLAVAGAR